MAATAASYDAVAASYADAMVHELRQDDAEQDVGLRDR